MKCALAIIPKRPIKRCVPQFKRLFQTKALGRQADWKLVRLYVYTCVCACTRVRMSVQAVHDFYATQRRDRSWLRRECRCEGTVEAGGLVSLGCISVLLAEYAATVNDMFSQMTMTTTKQIDHKAYIPAELSRFDRYTQLFLSFPSLFPPSLFLIWCS